MKMTNIKKEHPKLDQTIFTWEDYTKRGFRNYADKMRWIEEQWRKSLKMSEKELIETFQPEIKGILRAKIREYKQKERQWTNLIKRRLRQMKRLTSDEFSQWFGREWVKVNEGEELAKAKSHLLRLRRQLKIARGEKQTKPKGWISEEEKQRALQIPLVEIAERYLPGLKKVGRLWKANCPFHPDKNPSFTIFEDNHFYCFGCKESGSVINFIMKIENCSFQEAVRRLLNY